MLCGSPQHTALAGEPPKKRLFTPTLSGILASLVPAQTLFACGSNLLSNRQIGLPIQSLPQGRLRSGLAVVGECPGACRAHQRGLIVEPVDQGAEARAIGPAAE